MDTVACSKVCSAAASCDAPPPNLGGKSFGSLEGDVSDKTLKAIAEMGFTDMMEIQHRSIRPLLEGRWVGFGWGWSGDKG